MNELAAWFSLKSIPGVGNYTYKRLVTAFGSPRQVFAATRTQLLAIEGVTEAIAGLIISHTPPDTVNKNIEICREKNISVITMTDNADVLFPADLNVFIDLHSFPTRRPTSMFWAGWNRKRPAFPLSVQGIQPITADQWPTS